MRSTRWSTRGGRLSSPPTGRPAISRRSKSACARGWPAAFASKWAGSTSLCASRYWRRASPRPRVSQPNFEVSPAVLAFVARSINSNGRDLDGAVNRLLAHTTLTGAPLSVETAETAIRDLVRPHEPKRVKIEDIQKLVASHYSVTRADILSSRRTATVVKPRQIAMYLAKTLTLRSLPEIGRRFGGRDHTTVLHAVRKIEGLSHADRTLNDELELLKRMLQD